MATVMCLCGLVFGAMNTQSGDGETASAPITQIVTEVHVTEIAGEYPTSEPCPPPEECPPCETMPPVIVTPTSPPEAEPMADKSAGFYLVNIDKTPGNWRNDGTSDGCYWEVTTQTGEIIDNHFGMGGGTMYVPPNAYEVELHAEFGTWQFLQP